MKRSREDNLLEPAGMKAGRFFKLSAGDLIKLPPGSDIFKLPSREAVVYDPVSLKFVSQKGRIAIAAFLPPGYTVTYNSAYKEIGKPRKLPLFAYAACALRHGDIYTAAVRVDVSPCHDSRFMDMRLVETNARKFLKIFPKNSLIRHLKNCALCYGCPNAKNFFLNKYEAPLPTSPSCNAQCAGCISYQPDGQIRQTQPRIKFIPSPEEIAQIALFHIKNTKNPIVSFGQGCEGEPLLCAGIIEKAIKLIRKATSKGVININTNASSPEAVARLFDAGLDSIRVSLNSVRQKFYTSYYNPMGYSFGDVAKSIDIAKKKKGFVSINYLTVPGFTDSKDEFTAFKKFLVIYGIDMIQWRNLNYDPLRYFKEMNIKPNASDMLGIKEIIDLLKKEFPKVRMGYFNTYEGVNSRRV
ncbi:MAG: radical SAM protein [Candidatus Omnitrophota bacterium]|nr:radical SAM protein [Candidatus Omnitrophota bacterium]